MSVFAPFIPFLVLVLVLSAVWWAAHRIARAFGVPAPWEGVIDAILVVMGLVALLRLAGWA